MSKVKAPRSAVGAKGRENHGFLSKARSRRRAFKGAGRPGRMWGLEPAERAAGSQPPDPVTNSGSPRVTNRVTGTRRVTSRAGSGEEKPAAGPPRAGGGKIFFGAGRGIELVTVSVEV